MANVVNSQPIVLDTAVANQAALSLIGNQELKVKRIEWFNPVTPADTFAIKDAGGNVLLEGYCETAHVSQVFTFNPALRWGVGTGWYLSQISSGKIYIYYD